MLGSNDLVCQPSTLAMERLTIRHLQILICSGLDLDHPFGYSLVQRFICQELRGVLLVVDVLMETAFCNTLKPHHLDKIVIRRELGVTVDVGQDLLGIRSEV
jgi:hypothetical protein